MAEARVAAKLAIANAVPKQKGESPTVFARVGFQAGLDELEHRRSIFVRVAPACRGSRRVPPG